MDTQQASIENQVPEATTPNEPPPELPATDVATPTEPVDDRPKPGYIDWSPGGC